MTLIVAKIIENQIVILSETLIKGPDHHNLNDNVHNFLKVFFLDKEYTIAYSGIKKYAHEIIKKIDLNINNFNSMIEIANYILSLKKDYANNSISCENNPDFLIFQKNNFDTIIEVKGLTQPKASNNSAWIGNHLAFNKFQENYLKSNNSKDKLNRFQSAFKEVCIDPVFNDLGENIITIIGDKKGFRYIPYMTLTSPIYSVLPPIQNSEKVYTVQWGNAEKGGFGYTIITPTETFQNGYGFYYFQGKYGIFYHIDVRNDIAETLKAYADNAKDFIGIIEKETQLRLEYVGLLN